MDENTISVCQAVSSIIPIKRFEPFDPENFFGSGCEGWTLWRGDQNGDGLTGNILDDPRSLSLNRLDPKALLFETDLKEPNLSGLTGFDKLELLRRNGHVLPDALIFLALWLNQSKIPRRWRAAIDEEPLFIHFGTVIRDPYGQPCAICMYMLNGSWKYSTQHLSVEFPRNRIFACLLPAV